MLHFYDRTWSISVLAFAALATPLLTPANAGTNEAAGCQLADGYALSLVDFVEEADACLTRTQPERLRQLEADLFTLTERLRAKNGLDAHGTRESLNRAARAHALDMATRGFAGHQDLEGRGHVERLRALDRKLIFGATGANIVVVDAKAGGDEIYNALIADEVNKENLVRGAFSHMGLGLAQSGDKLYVVQLFTRLEGELRDNLPLTLSAVAEVETQFSDPLLYQDGWTLQAGDGTRIARGLAPRLQSGQLQDGTAYLGIVARIGADTYMLKGPAVSAN